MFRKLTNNLRTDGDIKKTYAQEIFGQLLKSDQGRRRYRTKLREKSFGQFAHHQVVIGVDVTPIRRFSQKETLWDSLKIL